MTPEIKEAVSFIDDSLGLSLGILADLADPETNEALEDIRGAHAAHRRVLEAAGLVDPLPVEPVEPVTGVEPEVLTNPDPDLINVINRLSSTSSQGAPE